MGWKELTTVMTELDAMYGFRAEMVEELKLDLLGPGEGASEVLAEPPLDRYVVGVLWPTDEPPAGGAGTRQCRSGFH